jgi:hypothetical protein
MSNDASMGIMNESGNVVARLQCVEIVQMTSLRENFRPQCNSRAAEGGRDGEWWTRSEFESAQRRGWWSEYVL